MTLLLRNIPSVQNKIKTYGSPLIFFGIGLMAQSNLGLECIVKFVTEKNLNLPYNKATINNIF
jgi:hypothetical protein